jgi:hypothetical protein
VRARKPVMTRIIKRSIAEDNSRAKKEMLTKIRKMREKLKIVQGKMEVAC